MAMGTHAREEGPVYDLAECQLSWSTRNLEVSTTETPKKLCRNVAKG